MEAYLAEHRYPRLEALLADIALGNRMPQQVAQALAREAPAQARQRPVDMPLPRREDKILITGAERGVISFANCCLPIPGRRDHGLPHRRQGHRGAPAGLPQRRRVPQVARPLGADRLGPRGQPAISPTALRIELDNRPGALAQVAAAIAEAESNIDRVEYLDRDTNVAAMRFPIEVRDRKHLAEVMRRVRRLNVVLGVQRM